MKPEKRPVFREPVVQEAVARLERAARNGVTSVEARGSGKVGTRWVTSSELSAIDASLRDTYDGVTTSEVAEVARRLGAASVAVWTLPEGANLVERLADAAAAARRLAPVFDEGEVVEVDLRAVLAADVESAPAILATPSASPARGSLLLSLPDQTVERILRAEESTLKRTAFDPVPRPARIEGDHLPDPYEVEPKALLEVTGKTAVILSGHPEHFDPWRAQRNTFDNNWAHAYAGQFAATLFSEAVMTVAGKGGLSSGQREVTKVLGDFFGAAVMRAKEELDVGVTPDDVPLTIRRTFRIQLNEREHLEVTPQLTLTAGDMKTFDPTKGSQYFSVRVRFP